MFYYYDPGAGAAYSEDSGTPLWNDYPGYFNDPEDNNNVFYNMDECAGNVRPDAQASEYCGVRPTVSNVAIDGRTYAYDNYEISSGQMVELTFNSVVDPQQLPLKQIEINWGDGDKTPDDWDSSAGEHIYNHAYTCTSDDFPVDGYCNFIIDITLVDNWGWCSGDDHTADADHLPGPASFRAIAAPEGEIFDDCGSGNYAPFAIVVPE